MKVPYLNNVLVNNVITFAASGRCQRLTVFHLDRTEHDLQTFLVDKRIFAKRLLQAKEVWVCELKVWSLFLKL